MKTLATRSYPKLSPKEPKTNEQPYHSNRVIWDGSTIVEYHSLNERGLFFIMAFNQLLSEPWFVDLKTTTCYINSIKCFTNWLNNQQDVEVGILNEYQAYEINTLGRKPQSCYSHQIKTIIKRVSPRLELRDQYQFLKKVEQNSRLDRGDGSTNSVHISEWFTKQQWLRQDLGEDYLLFESPKRVHQSFRTLVSEALIYLIQARTAFNLSKGIKKAYFKASNNNLKSSRAIAYLYSDLLNIAKDELQDTSSPLFNVILCECVKGNRLKDILTKVESTPSYNFRDELKNINSGYPFLRPSLLLDSISETEELLMYWLIVSLAVQPSDAANTSRNNLAIKRNEMGRIKTLQIKYFKGRSDRFYETPMLTGKDIVLMATTMYLQAIPQDQKRLFNSRDINKNRKFSNPFYSGRTTEKSNPIIHFMKLIRNDNFGKVIDKSKKTNIVFKALRCLSKAQLMDFQSYTSNMKKNDEQALYDEYQMSVEFPLPQSFITPSHIKNTSVYSRSDKYRDGDLVNSNSHDPLTEKLRYMTDDNKEWINQSGRISRMVMAELENEVYNPILRRITHLTSEIQLSTKIVKSNAGIDSDNNKSTNLNHLEGELIVIESEDTAVQMLYFIEQAYKYQKSLIERNDIFFFETVLVRSEWMHYCIEKFSPNIVRSASEKLNKIRHVLPSLFLNQLNSGESA
ncbi:hypothetical protein QFX18_12405 [Saccharophagus degradans]|uniref:hypothetical protein n=1 Tax=Saccharophagus degradans TaxID=86304 RepID=UPI0024782974|nr:hypothetical protein [Saccharophagus degradans]WGO96849.1 hypothetical protein QFX18_12405 [Saccharophagus degradans]